MGLISINTSKAISKTSWLQTHVNQSPWWLLILEALALLVWFTLTTLLFAKEQNQTTLQPLTKEALEMTISNERWNGIFFHDQKAGFAVNRTSSSADGTLLMEQRSVLKVATFGRMQTIITASAALTDSDGYLKRFDFFMKAEDTQLSVRGEIKETQIVMELDQGTGELQYLDFPISKRPHVSLSLEAMLKQTKLAIGKEFNVPYFDPVSMSDGEMTIRVVDTEILENGDEAYWITSNFNDIKTSSLVSSDGDILRQEGALGISMVRMTAEEAQKFDSNKDPVDLISLSAVNLKGRIKDPRHTTQLSFKIDGVKMEKVFNQPPLQVVGKRIVTIDIPKLSELPLEPMALQNPTDAQQKWLRDTLDIPSAHPKIIDQAEEVTQNATHRIDAVQKLNNFVYEYLEKIPVIGVPNGLNVLEAKQGDCNEHTILFVSLARAVNIPTRLAAGVVYSDRTGPIGQFYYHAWPEVFMGELDTPAGKQEIWLPVDPTFGQVPADATHIKLVEGGLDRQVEIMAFLGQLELTLVQQGNQAQSEAEKSPKQEEESQ